RARLDVLGQEVRDLRGLAARAVLLESLEGNPVHRLHRARKPLARGSTLGPDSDPDLEPVPPRHRSPSAFGLHLSPRLAAPAPAWRTRPGEPHTPSQPPPSRPARRSAALERPPTTIGTGGSGAGRIHARSNEKNSPAWLTGSPRKSARSATSDSSVRRPRVL